MERPTRDAKARRSEPVAYARKGKRVITAGRGRPTAEPVRCNRRGGVDFDKLEAARRRLGIENDGEGWPEEFNDPAFSREVLGLDER